ncbi:MAG: Multidrug resistance protein MdtH [Elusimicrobia bacterium]|nr:Multidrug resistance protein MdtH [Elusimicrobiota bacterium]
MLTNRLSRFGIPKSAFFLGVVSFFTDAASEMIYPLLPLFLAQQLGASAAFIGLVEGVADSTASVAKFYFGWLSDRLKKRTRFVVMGYSIANLFRPLIGLALFPWHVLVLRFIDRIGKGMRTAPRDAWLSGLVDHHRRGTIFGFHRAMDHAGAVVGPLLATLFLWFYPGNYRSLFLISVIPGICAVYFIVLAKRASNEPPRPKGPLVTPRLAAALPLMFKRYLMILMVFTLGSANDVFLLLKLQSIGLAPKWIPVSWALLHVIKSLCSMPGGKLADRIGYRHAILMGWMVLGGVYLLLGFFTHPAIVLVVFLFYGLYPALTESAERALIAGLVADESRATAFGIHNLTVGLCALPAGLLFGYLWTVGGPRLAFWSGASLVFLASLALSILMRAHPRGASMNYS